MENDQVCISSMTRDQLQHKFTVLTTLKQLVHHATSCHVISRNWDVVKLKRTWQTQEHSVTSCDAF